MNIHTLIKEIIFYNSYYQNKNLNKLMKKYKFDALNHKAVVYLDIIYLNQPIKPSEMASLTSVSRAAVTKIIKNLEKYHLIIKNPLDKSGHSYELLLSDVGTAFYNDILVYDDFIADVFCQILNNNQANIKFLQDKLNELKKQCT